MDALIETIAEQLGPKWTQLYSHLLLGPRDRYKFETNHRGLHIYNYLPTG